MPTALSQSLQQCNYIAATAVDKWDFASVRPRSHARGRVWSPTGKVGPPEGGCRLWQDTLRNRVVTIRSIEDVLASRRRVRYNLVSQFAPCFWYKQRRLANGIDLAADCRGGFDQSIRNCCTLVGGTQRGCRW